ncbi:MAG: type IV pilus twitching motility protein PilT [Oscillospiraceae bacterium]|nr:type IV pilus twitching motility protein PilT [Oscillospiraceae bacterium]
MNLLEIFKEATEKKASDIFIVAGLPLSIKVKGEIIPIIPDRLMPDDTEIVVKEIFDIAQNPNWERFLETGDADFSMSVPPYGRFRVNTYRQRSSLAAVLRLVAFGLPDPASLGIPPAVVALYKHTKGLILVTGPTGSGKSTTLACVVDEINKNRKGHIMTLEDPIEFIHRHQQSIVSQREVPSDTLSYLQALKAVLRQSPDVIQIGEMRDIETIGIALTAAETGHLVLSTLHTSSAAATIDRIVDIFPPQAQHQVRLQLSMTLVAVVSQILVPTVDKGLAAAFEVMICTNAVANMIRENKLNQLNSVIHTSGDIGMQTMDSSLVNLVKKGAITKDTAMLYSPNPEIITRML